MIPDSDDGRWWRWANVPVPRSHLAGLAIGVLLQRVRPWRLPVLRRLSVVVGPGTIALNAAVVGWSVLTMGRVASGDPERRGPYAVSRNPMYVAWTGLYLRLAVLFRSVRVLLLTPVVATAVHRTVLREEDELARSFGEAYRSYRAGVPRYL